MNDDDPTPTPGREREVRRLLADARHTEPVPEEVAARLDRVLVELARGEADDPTPVAVLASRRRQRAVSMLVAAAAVVAIGIGLGQVVGTGTDSSSDSPSATSAEAGAVSTDGDTGGDMGGDRDAAGPEAGRHLDSVTGSVSESAPTYAVPSPLTIRPDDFSAEAVRLQELAGQPTPTGSNSANGAFGAGELSSALQGFECTVGDWGAGTFVPVLYGGDPGVLVFRAVNGDTQVADLFLCGSPDALRSITLPAP